jgi:predicted PurR-regulated permease PerM
MLQRFSIRSYDPPNVRFGSHKPREEKIMRSINRESGENSGENSGEKPRSIAFYVFLGAALFAFMQSYWLLSPILLSFLLVMLISLAVYPLISWIRSLTGGRKVPAGFVVGGFVAVVVLTGWAFFGPMMESVTNLTQQLPEYWERLQKPLIRMEQQAALTEEKLQAEVATERARTGMAEGDTEVAQRITESTQPASPEDDGSLRSGISGMFRGVVGSFIAIAFNGGQILVVMVTVFFGVTFMLMNPRPILGAMFSLVPERHHDHTQIIMQRIGKFAPNWAAAQLVGMVAVGLLVFVAMWLILGFNDALILGLVAGVLAAVPYVGPILSAVPALLLAIGIGGMTPLWVLLAFIAVQALEGNVIQPFVMARGMKLHPMAVVFSMLLCVAAFGVLGVLIAAPMVAIVDILHDELYRKRYLPTVTDADLDRLAGNALREKPSSSK